MIQQTLDRDFFGMLTGEELERLEQQPEGVWEMIYLNSLEFVVAEAQLREEGKPAFRVQDVVFAPGGPLLGLDQRKYLQEIFSRPLSLYEVTAAYPGEGLELQNLVLLEEPRRFLIETSASLSLKPGMVFATRLLDLGGWEMSASVYPFPEPRVPEVLEVARESDPRSSAIILEWLRSLAAPFPEIVQAGSGEPILLITDHYEILDADGLADALEKQSDVESNGENGWVRLEDSGAGMSRPILSLNLDAARPERLEAFARTQQMADEGRQWLEACTGATLRHITREIVDPLGALEGASGGPPPRRGSSPTGSNELMAQLPPDFLQKFIEENVYRNWPDEPIPALKNQTPRQAIRNSRGKQKVVDLLLSYERGDLRQAQDEGREPVDFGFLWSDLGLEREG